MHVEVRDAVDPARGRRRGGAGEGLSPRGREAVPELSGCVRRGETAGVAQDETVGVALITAAAEVRTTRTLSS